MFAASGIIATISCAFALGMGGLAAFIETRLQGTPYRPRPDSGDRETAETDHLKFWHARAPSVLMTLHVVQLVSLLTALYLSIAAGLVRRAGGETNLWGTLVAIGLAWLVTQLGCRAAAKRSADPIGAFAMSAAQAVTVVFTPIVRPLLLLGNLLGWGVAGLRRSTGVYWTTHELEDLLTEAHGEALGQPGQELLSSIISFSDTVIREIMVPRTEMVAVSIAASTEDIHDVVLTGGHSRIPVYDETIDNICGLLHIKDLFAADIRQLKHPAQEGSQLLSLLRPAFYVPEVMKISELLRDFQKRKTHMAIVVDEYGGTAGVVTLEDIIEEIVGEIQDEYDVDEKQFRLMGDSKVIADGRTDLDELGEVLGVDFPDDPGYETLAGFLTSQAGYLPEVGAVISWDALIFTVKEANEKRIALVEVDKSGARATP